MVSLQNKLASLETRTFTGSKGPQKALVCLSTNSIVRESCLMKHRDWLDGISFLPFQNITRSHSAEYAAGWLEATSLILSDLHNLLTKPCHIFWSHLIFDDSLRSCLDSYLKLAPRYYDCRLRDTKLAVRMDDLHATYFKIFLRMTTCKESAENYFTPSVFGTILYDNFILDIPKILDMCVLFNSSNQTILMKMIGNVFTLQPKYLDDVSTALPPLTQLFTDLIDRLTDDKLTYPRQLDAPNPENSVSHVDVIDLCLYASDICHTLHSFLFIYPPACIPFHRAHIYKTLALFYEEVLEKLLNQLDSANLSVDDEKLAYQRLTEAQDHAISLFRHILFTSTLGKLLSQSKREEPIVQQFYDILTEALGETRFIGHYSNKFPFREDIDLLDQLSITSDSARQTFIRDGLLTAESLRDKAIAEANQPPAPTSTQEEAVTEEAAGASTESSPCPPSAQPSASALSISPDVQTILDMFPHLGLGFIEMCFRHYSSVDTLINALLEESLPDSLSKLDRALPIAPEEETLVSSRRNVFDGDKFDIFRSKSVDASKIHRGKRATDLSLDEGKYKEKIKDLASAYNKMSVQGGGNSLLGTTGIMSTFDSCMYDDEYDDTYDANEVGADDADDAQELMGRRMVLPVALGGSGVAEDEEEEEGPPANQNPSDGQTGPNQRPKYDVKGKAKGQGQSADVTRNRNFKTAHKARGANHNRKAGARSKMSKGMF